jgi:predicted permease
LFSAGLLVQTFRALSTIDPGFVSKDLTTFAVSASRARHPGRVRVSAFYDALDREIRGLVGVQDVAMGSEVPLTTNGQLDIIMPKERGDRGKENPQVRTATVAPGFWRTLGVPLRAGRTFTAADDSAAARVVVVNDALAERFYPGEDPVGRIIRWGELEWQIIGVVGSMRMRSLAEPAQPEVYSSGTQDVLRFRYVFVKSTLSSAQLIPQLRQALGRVDPTVALTEVSSMDERIRDALAPQRFRAVLTGGLGVLAVALATLGIYAVVAYTVGRQTREIGVRMALGEDAGQVRRRVVSSALKMASGGVAIGVVLALATSRWLASFVVGVNPRDPAMLGGAAIVLAGVAVIAAAVPARRASRVDPLVALRSD